MSHTVKNTWPLLLGVTVLFLGSGMLYTLIVVRATVEGFSRYSVGILQSGYQVGWLIAAFLIPYLIRTVGHIRVFAALATLGSGIILTHLLWINPWLWTIERLVMGTCTAGLMIVAESWLNDLASNKSRGKILAVYTILSWGGPVLGMYLLNYGDITTVFFFLIASILLSVATIPILLTATQTPEFLQVERINVAKLYKLVPVAVLGAFFSGMIHGSFFGAVSIYGLAEGLTAGQTAKLSAVALGSGILIQWPIALLSDRYDRRIILAVTSLLAGIPAILFSLKGDLSIALIYSSVAVFGCFSMGLYSQCIAHANDHLESHQIVPATGTLILIYGVGFAITPFLTSLLIDYSPSYFLRINGILTLLLTLFVIYRVMKKDALEEKGEMVPVSTISPYASILTAAEEWSDEKTLENDGEEK